MKPNWMKEVFRNAEGEGAGGASPSGGEGAQPAPTAEQLTALESRLDRITQAYESQTTEQRQRSAQEAIQGRANQLDQAKKAAEAAVGAAEQTLADAFDNGEGVEIAKAQRALTEAVAKRERADIAVENFMDQVKAAEHKAKSQKPDLDDQNLRDWKSKHSSWYGVDAEMTKASHEADRQIRAAGVLSVGSKEYFEAIDRTMSQRYPDKFGGTPPTGGGRGGQPAPNRPGRGRIQQSVADGWRRMGLDMGDPKVVEKMVQNRQKAVEKGILPEQPVTGAIVTR